MIRTRNPYFSRRLEHPFNLCLHIGHFLMPENMCCPFVGQPDGSAKTITDGFHRSPTKAPQRTSPPAKRLPRTLPKDSRCCSSRQRGRRGRSLAGQSLLAPFHRSRLTVHRPKGPARRPERPGRCRPKQERRGSGGSKGRRRVGLAAAWNTSSSAGAGGGLARKKGCRALNSSSIAGSGVNVSERHVEQGISFLPLRLWSSQHPNPNGNRRPRRL